MLPWSRGTIHAMRYHAYHELLDNNRRWARERLAEDPTFFARLTEGQRPPFLFIGCSDSRKPLNTITGTDPGELFIHRNVANLVRVDDPNGRAVLEYAVEVLEVRHVIVCGHTRCGGVEAAIRGGTGGVVGEWIAPLEALYRERRAEVDATEAMEERVERLARLNVVAQVEHVLTIPAVRRALEETRGPAEDGEAPAVGAAGRAPGSARLEVHGWLFRVETGLIDEVDLPVDRWRAEGVLPG